MAHQHLKSACCRAQCIHYGGKRRQCVKCKRTWTVRPKRPGRKRLRATEKLIERYLSKSTSTFANAQRSSGWSRGHTQRMMRQSLSYFVSRHKDDWLGILPHQGDLIAVSDAMWHWIEREKVTIYLIFLRPVRGKVAVALPPVFFPGHENREGWGYAWSRVSPALKKRIRSLICDGQKWLVALGHRQGWALQRCHFHLLANLQMYLGARNKERNEVVLYHVRRILSTKDAMRSRKSLRVLRRFRSTSRSRGMRRVLSGFATNYRDFQTYLRYPELNLPTTTNTAESYISGIRDLMRRSRGFRSKESLQLWIAGYTCWRKTIYCNGKHQQR